MGRTRDYLTLVTLPRRRRWALITLICLLLTAVPLVGTLGYENSFVLAPIFALLGIGVGVDVAHQARRSGSLRGLTWRVTKELLVMHGLALAVLLLGQVWQRSCDPLGGLLFYAMGPALTGSLGAICGIWAGVLLRGRRRALLLGFVPMAGCIAIALWRLYHDPVVYAFDPFWGYFSGSVYDEAVGVGSRYYSFRGYNLIAATAAVLGFALLVDPTQLRLRRSLYDILSARPRRATALLTIATVMCAGGALSIGMRGASFGFTANLASIDRVLSSTYETEHFVIHFTPRSADARTIEQIAAEHEFAWYRLQTAMGRAPSRKVHSFLFSSPDQKRAAMGAGTVQVAAPWRHQIYLDHRAFPHPVLHHELAHIFGNTIGDSIFGVSRDGLKLNIGLIEGFATAMAPRRADRLDLHDQVKVLEALQRRPSIATIMGPGFFAKSSRVAYTTAGSFCRWLIDTHGFEPMATLYRTAGDFEAAYDEPLETLEAEWIAFILQRPGVRDEDVATQAERFKRRSVFQRPCAHRVADLRRDVARHEHRGDFAAAVGGYRNLCALEPHSPMHKLGLAYGLAQAKLFADARATLSETEAMPDLTASILSVIHERRGDLELTALALEAAVQAYDAALELPVSERHRRVLQLKRTAAADPELAPLMVRYFGLFDVDADVLTGALDRLASAYEIANLADHEALGHYLVGRQLLNIQRPAQALTEFELALGAAASLPSDEFRRAAQHALMNASLQVGAYDRARLLLAQLKRDPIIGNGHRLDYAYWDGRIDFFEAYRAVQARQAAL